MSVLPADPQIRSEMLCKSHPGAWSERKRPHEHAPFHWEWYNLAQRWTRLCIVAPREHSKTETFTLNYAVWRMRYNPGLQVYVFTGTGDLADELKIRFDQVVEETEPELWDRRLRPEQHDEATYGNGSRVKLAGAGKTIRGPHPDLIIGDDVLDEAHCTTRLQRERTKRWWLGTIGPMAHGGTTRRVDSRLYRVPPTSIILVGTPFHGDDLIMSLKHNRVYRWRRYSAEYDPDTLPLEGSVAVDVG